MSLYLFYFWDAPYYQLPWNTFRSQITKIILLALGIFLLGKRLVTKIWNIAGVLQRQLHHSSPLEEKTIIYLLYIGYFTNLWIMEWSQWMIRGWRLEYGQHRSELPRPGLPQWEVNRWTFFFWLKENAWKTTTVFPSACQRLDIALKNNGELAMLLHLSDGISETVAERRKCFWQSLPAPLALKLQRDTLGPSAGSPDSPNVPLAESGRGLATGIILSTRQQMNLWHCHHGCQKHKRTQEVLRHSCGRLWTWAAMKHGCNPWYRQSLNHRLGRYHHWSHSPSPAAGRHKARLWSGPGQPSLGCLKNAGGNLCWLSMCRGCVQFTCAYSSSAVSSVWIQMMQDSTEITGIIFSVWTDTFERLIMLRCSWTKTLFPNSFEDAKWLTSETKSRATLWKKSFFFSRGAKQNPWISAYQSICCLCLGLFKSISKILGFIWSLIIDCQLWCFILINCRLTHILSQVVHSS